jgi:hypothetical protein
MNVCECRRGLSKIRLIEGDDAHKSEGSEMLAKQVCAGYLLRSRQEREEGGKSPDPITHSSHGRCSFLFFFALSLR